MHLNECAAGPRPRSPQWTDVETEAWSGWCRLLYEPNACPSGASGFGVKATGLPPTRMHRQRPLPSRPPRAPRRWVPGPPLSVFAMVLGHFREPGRLGAVEPKWYVIRMLYFVENKNVRNRLVSGKSNWDSEIHIFPCSALNLLIRENAHLRI